MYPRRAEDGLFQDSFYRIKSCYDTGGETALCRDRSEKPILANRMDIAWENAIVQMATDYPAYGQLVHQNELRKKGDFCFTGRFLFYIWMQHDQEPWLVWALWKRKWLKTD